MKDVFVSTFRVDLCGVAIKEDRGALFGLQQLGGDPSLVLSELHIVMRHRFAAEGQLLALQLHHSRGTHGQEGQRKEGQRKEGQRKEGRKGDASQVCC